jgi:hypothetical protein
MTILSSLRSLYTLDTLDTRFTNSPKTPYKDVIKAREENRPLPGRDIAKKLDSRGQPIGPAASLWDTAEFYFYYLVIAVAVPYMFWVAYDVSKRQYIFEVSSGPLLIPAQLPTLTTRNTSISFPTVGYRDAR